MKIGSAISKVATPIAGVFGLDCYDPKTHALRLDSPCAKTVRALDERRWRDALVTPIPIFDHFWAVPKLTKGENMKEWGVQVIVKADTLKELEEKLPDMQILAVQLRPPRPEGPQTVPGIATPQPPVASKK